MSTRDWQDLLSKWNSELLNCEDIVENLPSDVVSSGWLGYPGATEEQIAQAEARLDIHLPLSYRAFGQVTNGWRQVTHFIYKLWPVEEIEWFATRRRAWLDVFRDPRLTLAPPISDEEYFLYG